MRCKPAIFTLLLAFIAAPCLAKDEPKKAPDVVAPTLKDVRYGPYDRNLLDVYRVDTKKPAPVLIHFHGGGWVGGDKAPYDAAPYLKSGIVVVSANYRFVEKSKDAAPYPAPMNDCARVVQFVRSKAKEWNIDPERVALTGGSAGAVNSMWIAYRDDMAKPDSTDPVERYSTRVTCLVPEAGPTSLDPEAIVPRIGGDPNVIWCLLPFFDIKQLEELKSPGKRKLVEEASPITHVTKDDPPTFLKYGTPLGDTPLPAKTSVMYSIHHAEFGAMIKEKLDAVGVETEFQTLGDGKPTDASLVFLRKYLKPEPPNAN